MGKIRQGLLGPLSGKVGNVIGSHWRGIDYLRVVPAHVHDPKTPPQLRQRGKFIKVLRYLQPLLGFLRLGFGGYARGMSAFNAAMSYNMRHAVDGELLLSRGTLRSVPEATATASGAQTIEVSWEDNSGLGNASSDDNVIIVVVNEDKADLTVNLVAGERADGTAEISVPEAYTGDMVQVFLAFSVLDGLLGGSVRNSISDSVFAGSVEVL